MCQCQTLHVGYTDTCVMTMSDSHTVHFIHQVEVWCRYTYLSGALSLASSTLVGPRSSLKLSSAPSPASPLLITRVIQGPLQHMQDQGGHNLCLCVCMCACVRAYHPPCHKLNQLLKVVLISQEQSITAT